MTRGMKRLSLTVLIVLVMAIAGLFYHLAGPAYMHDNWHYEVVMDDLDGISSVLPYEGGLYATLEKTKKRGSLIQISDGKVKVLLTGLTKPNRLVQSDETIYISSEQPATLGPGLLAYHPDGTSEYIKGVVSGEGIDREDATHILVIEDNGDIGRLLEIDTRSHDINVLLSGLQQAEGVCKHIDGRIFYTEKIKNTLSVYDHGKTRVVRDDLYKPTYLNCLDNGDILITEDSSNRGRLLKLDTKGNLTVIASHLRAPQTVIVRPKGDLLLAEEGRKRIIRIWQE